MRSVFEVFIEIVLALAGAVFFGALAVAIMAFGVGCAVFGSCWGFMGWRRRRAARLKDR
jgi:hypothetical protein